MGHAINPLIYKKLPYDGDKDFTPISLIATFPQLVLVHPSLKAKTLAELIGAGQDSHAAAHLRARAATAPRSISPARCSRTWPASP